MLAFYSVPPVLLIAFQFYDIIVFNGEQAYSYRSELHMNLKMHILSFVVYPLVFIRRNVSWSQKP